MSIAADPLTLVQSALDQFESSSLAGSTRTSLRVAQLRGDTRDAWFFRAELRPHGGSGLLRATELREILGTDDFALAKRQHSVLQEEWLLERQPSRVPSVLQEFISDDSIMAGSIEELEASLDRVNVEAATATDANQRAIFTARASLEREVLGRIRHRTFSYLCRAERELTYAGINARIFDRRRARVDARLSALAPEVLDQFSAAYRSMLEGDPESRAQAVTSCRRVLKSVADIVYPASSTPIVDDQGREHLVTDDAYVNRLWEFLRLQSGGRLVESMHGTLTEVGGRVDRLYGLSSKGVHAEVSVAEAEWCVIQTYLLVGEILDMHASS